MKPLIDRAGRRYSRLTVLHRDPANPKNCWLCRCDCGVQISVRVSNLISGNTRSCGCLHIETMRARQFRHGHASRVAETPTYVSWRGMIERCTNPKHFAYHRYGGRGITIDPRWRGTRGFSHFLLDMGDRKPGTTLDRIDSDDHYTPGNCRWATPKQQVRNSGKTKLDLLKVTEIRLDSRPLNVIAAEYGVTVTTVRDIHKGKSWT